MDANLRDTKSETDGDEGAIVRDDGGQSRNSTPCADDDREPDPRAETTQHDVGGKFRGTIREEKIGQCKVELGASHGYTTRRTCISEAR